MYEVSDHTLSALPVVSVLMSVYNGESYLIQSIDSILNQSICNFEFIIIDDGSKDSSWEILTKASDRDSRIRLLRNESNLGLSKSLNRGMALAKGAYIARQDADDVSHPGRLARQLGLFETTPGLILAGSAYWVIDGEGQIIRIDRLPADDTSIRWHMLFHNGFAHSSVMIRADILTAHGLSYNEVCRYAQDYELWSRLLDYGAVANCVEPLICYRLHDSNRCEEVNREQQSIATRIAKANLGKLGIEVGEQEMLDLRVLNLGQLTTNQELDLHNYSLLVQILSRFAEKCPVNQSKLAIIRRNLLIGLFRQYRRGVPCWEIVRLAWAVIDVDVRSIILSCGSSSLDWVGTYFQKLLRHQASGNRNCF